MKTPLSEQHMTMGARMAPFAGWDMPIQYAGILQEHQHTRQSTSVFDTCHMGEFEFSGPGALATLERLLTQRVGSLRAGQARYGYFLNEEGGVLDDIICFRRAEKCFLVVVNAGTREGDAAWVRAHLGPETEFQDVSDQTGKLDIQGPTSRESLESAFGIQLPDLGFFSFTEMHLGDVPVTVSRTGYTGEFGYEVFFPIGQTVNFW
ncbi:MAG: glycine cleavage system protein T, partial [Kiritimatiellia bacterium]|nr:glycine cleavage system protein T [Kiritimatiellia bacterium]